MKYFGKKQAKTCNFYKLKYMYTPGKVVKGNQKLCKLNPYGSSRPWLTDLQTVIKQVNAPWILLFVNFRRYIFLNRAIWFPIDL